MAKHTTDHVSFAQKFVSCELLTKPLDFCFSWLQKLSFGREFEFLGVLSSNSKISVMDCFSLDQFQNLFFSQEFSLITFGREKDHPIAQSVLTSFGRCLLSLIA